MKKGVWVIFFVVLAQILLDADRHASAVDVSEILSSLSKIQAFGNRDGCYFCMSCSFLPREQIDLITFCLFVLFDFCIWKGVIHQIVALMSLRVLGEDSPHLSLLIRNKGRKALDVKIGATDFVHPEDMSDSVKPNRDRENWKLDVSW